MVFHGFKFVLHGSLLVFMVFSLFLCSIVVGFSWFLVGFHIFVGFQVGFSWFKVSFYVFFIPGLFFMVCHGSRLVCHGSRSVFIGFHGSRLVS